MQCKNDKTTLGTTPSTKERSTLGTIPSTHSPSTTRFPAPINGNRSRTQGKAPPPASALTRAPTETKENAGNPAPLENKRSLRSTNANEPNTTQRS
jgi:hypothetical protein